MRTLIRDNTETHVRLGHARNSYSAVIWYVNTGLSAKTDELLAPLDVPKVHQF